MTGQLVPFPSPALACVSCGRSLAAIASHPNTGQCHPCYMAERTAPAAPAELPAPVTDRDEAIAAIRAALRRRSGRAWSVTGGRGTVWGWITVDAPPSRATWGYRLRAGAVTDRPEDYEPFDTGEPGRLMSPEDRAELARLLGRESVPVQGVSIPAGHDYRTEYVDRAEGRVPRTTGTPYWD